MTPDFSWACTNIDDIKNITLISASSVQKEIKVNKINKTEISKIVAETLAKKAQEKKITKRDS